MDTLDKGYCLVLSGGGAKGIYHIGVWRALKELGIEVSAITGASIGAIIAGFLAQGSDDKLEELGRSITVDSILALPQEFTENGRIKVDRTSIAGAKDLFHSLVGNKGLDTSPLRNLLVAGIDEQAIRTKGRDLGIVTVNLSTMKPREVFIEEMEEGRLVDYLMASAAFPGFQQTMIEGKTYVDGGIYDNIPYAMARRRGYRRIIVSDVSGFGQNKRPDVEGSLTAYIKNSIDMGGVLNFDRRFLDDYTQLGYLDTLHTFGRYEGHYYFVQPDSGAESLFRAAGGLRRKGPSSSRARSRTPVFPDIMRFDRNILLNYLECAATILEVERIRVYEYASLTDAIVDKTLLDEKRIAAIINEGTTRKASVIAALRDAIINRHFDASPYVYWRLVEEFMPGSAGNVLRKALEGIFPALPMGKEYIRSLS
ncbi:MAG: patatin-like phospholipase family protein [Spirochaetaceae bacterium]|nr:patatin-like phospholipase family protein [Spirochaetaceae bacterium]